MGDVTLQHLTKQYDEETAVNDMNLEIEDGEFVTLVGPSGCGKSTTIEMIAGLTTPTDGKVFIGEEDVTSLPPKDRQIAMVFQNIALFPHMDVYDNISFGLRLRDFDTDEIDRRVENAAETVQLQGMLDRMPDELSGGQRQRVAIARAIVREPEVFLMDEPLANLDAALRVHMRTELQRLHQELDTTIVYVTHDQEEAMTMSDRIAVINDGELQQFADPLTCYRQPANRFVAGFIGSPSMNFFEGELSDGAVRTPYFDVTVEDDIGLSDGQDVTLGIRPENVAHTDSVDELDDPTDSFEATIDVVEPIGDEVFVYLALEADEGHRGMEGSDAELMMSVPPDPSLTDKVEGRTISVCIDRSKVHLFDGASGDAVVHGLAPEQQPETSVQETDQR